MAGAYIVTVDGDVEARSLRNNVDTAIVFANNSADAKAVAEASYAYTVPAPWAAATPLLVAPAADLNGWKFRVQVVNINPGSAYNALTSYVYGDYAIVAGVSYVNISSKGSLGVSPPNLDVWAPASGVVVVDQTYTGVTSDTFDLVGAAMVALLNADPSGLIAGAAYNAGTQVLKVAETTDGLGDHELVYSWVAPGSNENVNIPGFVVAHSDQGVAGAALTLTLAADAYTIPKVVAKFKRS